MKRTQDLLNLHASQQVGKSVIVELGTGPFGMNRIILRFPRFSRGILAEKIGLKCCKERLERLPMGSRPLRQRQEREVPQFKFDCVVVLQVIGRANGQQDEDLTDTSCVVEATIGILIFQKGMVFLYTII
jgi:hypothetical protein